MDAVARVTVRTRRLRDAMAVAQGDDGVVLGGLRRGVADLRQRAVLGERLRPAANNTMISDLLLGLQFSCVCMCVLCDSTKGLRVCVCVCVCLCVCAGLGAEACEWKDTGLHFCIGNPERVNHNLDPEIKFSNKHIFRTSPGIHIFLTNLMTRTSSTSTKVPFRHS